MAQSHDWNRSAEEILVDTDGFTVQSGGEHGFRVNWQDVRGVAAYKRDLFAVDQICLAFFAGRDRDVQSVHEHMKGYDSLLAEMERRYPDRDAEWWSKAAFPAFSTSWTVVWGDAPEPCECPSCHKDITGLATDRCPACSALLVTTECPECRGRGAHREWWWKWLAAVAGGAGATLVALTSESPSISASAPSLLAFGVALVLSAVVCAWFAVRDRPRPCTRCEGTGQWDPRGRAMRNR